jgi:hypothetical protein
VSLESMSASSNALRVCSLLSGSGCLYFPEHGIRVGAGFGRRAPQSLSGLVRVPRAVMLNESVENIPRIRQAHPVAFRGPALLPGFGREAI